MLYGGILLGSRGSGHDLQTEEIPKTHPPGISNNVIDTIILRTFTFIVTGTGIPVSKTGFTLTLVKFEIDLTTQFVFYNGSMGSC